MIIFLCAYDVLPVLRVENALASTVRIIFEIFLVSKAKPSGRGRTAGAAHGRMSLQRRQQVWRADTCVLF